MGNYWLVSIGKITIFKRLITTITQRGAGFLTGQCVSGYYIIGSDTTQDVILVAIVCEPERYHSMTNPAPR